jgi:hypothetical protein
VQVAGKTKVVSRGACAEISTDVDLVHVASALRIVQVSVVVVVI